MPEEYQTVERRIASQDRNIGPRPAPNWRPAPKNDWSSWTAADFKRLADQIKQAFNW